MKIRALLIQLPPPDHGGRYVTANVPLAAGYLAAQARTVLGYRVTVDILPALAAGYGGDEVIVKLMEAGEYHLIGFTVYLWNLERSLELARRIKATRRVLVAMGGPEIVPGRRLLDVSAVDAFVCGEGEDAFVALLSLLLEGKPWPRFFPARPPLDLAALPNPYLAGVLEFAAGGTVHLETMRGCPRRCAYCYYAKAHPAPRYFPEERLGPFFQKAEHVGAGEIYLMDPSCELRPRFDDFLRRLGEWNPARIPLHAEMSLEAVTEKRAILMARAGFVSVEAGLQSVNRRALAAVHRSWDEKKFLRGADSLRKAGIAVRTGIILGLPHDKLDDFGRTLDFAAEHDLADGLEVYPLSLLPGSELAARADRLGLSAMPLPPYWALATDALSFADFLAAEALLGKKLGKSLFTQPLPHFTNRHVPYIMYRELTTHAEMKALMANTGRIGNSLTLLMGESIFGDQAALAGLAHWLLEHNPHTLLQIVVRTDRDIPDEEARRASDLFFSPGSYLDRCHAFDDDPQARWSVRLFALSADPRRIAAWAERGAFMDPVFDCGPGAVAEAREALEQHQPPVLVRPGLGTGEMNELKEMYSGAEEWLLHYGD